PIDAADTVPIGGAVDQLLAWMQRLYLQPTPDEPVAWDDSRLSYSVTVAAPAGGDAQLTLAAPRYEGGKLDWSSFEVDPRAGALRVDDPEHEAPAREEEEISFLPVTA